MYKLIASNGKVDYGVNEYICSSVNDLDSLPPRCEPSSTAIDLWDTAENNPDNAPNLWEDINYKDGYRIIPEIITIGTAFALGERGWWNGFLYESLLATNTYTPEQYPAGWKLTNNN